MSQDIGDAFTAARGCRIRSRTRDEGTGRCRGIRQRSRWYACESNHKYAYRCQWRWGRRQELFWSALCISGWASAPDKHRPRRIYCLNISYEARRAETKDGGVGERRSCLWCRQSGLSPFHHHISSHPTSASSLFFILPDASCCYAATCSSLCFSYLPVFRWYSSGSSCSPSSSVSSTSSSFYSSSCFVFRLAACDSCVLSRHLAFRGGGACLFATGLSRSFVVVLDPGSERSIPRQVEGWWRGEAAQDSWSVGGKDRTWSK